MLVAGQSGSHLHSGSEFAKHSDEPKKQGPISMAKVKEAHGCAQVITLTDGDNFHPNGDGTLTGKSRIRFSDYTLLLGMLIFEKPGNQELEKHCNIPNSKSL